MFHWSPIILIKTDPLVTLRNTTLNVRNILRNFRTNIGPDIRNYRFLCILQNTIFYQKPVEGRKALIYNSGDFCVHFQGSITNNGRNGIQILYNDADPYV